MKSACSVFASAVVLSLVVAWVPQVAAQVGGSGTPNHISIWSNTHTLTNSSIFETNGGKVGINTTSPASTLDVNGGTTVRGLFSLPATGTATSHSGYNSQAMRLTASVFNSGTGTTAAQNFQWQAEPTGNNTSNTSGTLNLLYAAGKNPLAETGLNIASNGRITFAAGQAFPGTVASVTAGVDLTNTGSAGNPVLNVDTTQVPQLNTSNTFTGNQMVNGGVAAISFSGNGSGLSNLQGANVQGAVASADNASTANTANNALALGGRPPSDYALAGSLPSLVASVALTNQTADIPLTTLLTPTQNTLYRVSGYMDCLPGGVNGEVFLLYWTDTSGRHQSLDTIVGQFTPQCHPSGGASTASTWSFTIIDTSGSPLSYETSGANGAYDIFFTVEQLQGGNGNTRKGRMR